MQQQHAPRLFGAATACQDLKKRRRETEPAQPAHCETPIRPSSRWRRRRLATSTNSGHLPSISQTAVRPYQIVRVTAPARRLANVRSQCCPDPATRSIRLIKLHTRGIVINPLASVVISSRPRSCADRRIDRPAPCNRIRSAASWATGVVRGRIGGRSSSRQSCRRTAPAGAADRPMTVEDLLAALQQEFQPVRAGHLAARSIFMKVAATGVRCRPATP